MFSNQVASVQTAINRFSVCEQIEVNTVTVYATYTSGMFNAFYATEEDAIAHCSNPDNGSEFNGHWFQDEYSTFAPGELFSVVGNESVYVAQDRAHYIVAVMGRWQIPFTKWERVLSTRELAVQRP